MYVQFAAFQNCWPCAVVGTHPVFSSNNLFSLVTYTIFRVFHSFHDVMFCVLWSIFQLLCFKKMHRSLNFDYLTPFLLIIHTEVLEVNLNYIIITNIYVCMCTCLYYDALVGRRTRHVTSIK